MTSWARPGVKCVCVDARGTTMQKGGIYKIEWVLPPDSNDELGVLIEGYCAPYSPDNDIGAFRLSRFRPLITQSDDVALFKHHLVPVRELTTTPSG